MSFSYVALQRVQRLAPDLPLVMLLEHARHWPVLRPLVDEDWIVGPGIATLRKHPTFAKRLAASGRDIHVWTVNSEEDLRTCLDLGVRAVITDRPRYLLELLEGDRNPPDTLSHHGQEVPDQAPPAGDPPGRG
jgi:glycerophosphoryl diester phosphodiesterase